MFVERFLVRNPYDEPIQTALRLDAPGALEQGWEIGLDGFDFDEPFPLQPNEQALVTMTVTLPELNQSGEVTIIQERLDTPDVPKVMGGVTFRFRATFQVYLPLVLRVASVPEIIKDASNLIHQVEVDENGPGFDYEVDDIPAEAFSKEPIDSEPKDDEATPQEPERIHPVLLEMIGEDPARLRR